MRLKSFHGATLTEAMRMVRESLGENAIIVATRDDDNGGIRVTAAIDEVTTAASMPETAPAVPEGSEALEKIAEALTRHHVTQALAEKLMASATQFASDDPLLALGAAFDIHFKFSPIIEEKVVMLVGPPGAGKTLCTAKFATKSTMSKKHPTVVSTDLDRAGGMEQLAAFTRLLKLNLVEIEDCHALKDLIAMQNGNPVFVDTAGGNPFDVVERELFRTYIGAVGEATLVIPAGLDAAEAIDLASEFRSLGATRIMVTRIDSAKRLGSFLRIAYESQLPLSNFSASSKVTEAPQPMNPIVLARMILKIPGSQLKTQPAAIHKSAFGGSP